MGAGDMCTGGGVPMEVRGINMTQNCSYRWLQAKQCGLCELNKVFFNNRKLLSLLSYLASLPVYLFLAKPFLQMLA